MEQQQQTTTKVKVLTKTNTAVMLSVGLMAAFFVGLSMLFFMGNVVEKIAAPYKPAPIPIEENNPKMVKDIDYATVQIDPATKHDTDDMQYLKIYGNGYPNMNDSVDFGQYNFVGDWTGTETGYDDMDIADTTMPLAIQMSPGSHPAMLLTIHIPAYVGGTYEPPSGNDVPYINEEEGWDLLSSLFKINAAHALQIYDAETFSICIPEREYITTGYNKPADSKFGIKAANALIVDPNQGYSYLYVDEDGNTYYDMDLTQRANSEDCNNFTQRALNIGDIESGYITPENPSEEIAFTLAKGWENYLILGHYNNYDEYVDLQSDTIGVQSPLFLIGDAGAPWPETDEIETVTIEQFTFTMETDEGIKTLCVPETEYETYDYFVYFYDNDGMPYNDMLLTDEVDCGSSDEPQGCGWVTDTYCNKYPNHECCTLILNEEQQDIAL